ncbi:DUF6783 domain-containing protein [Blautia sp. HCP3S3_H10_2]|uniref:DUF6783 domain-containing protein n=1 Tax=Blautia sp. HCP3S3_H10_2 TaxID=3438747 RepID=UPI003F9237BC
MDFYNFFLHTFIRQLHNSQTRTTPLKEDKYTAKLGVQIAGMIFQTRSRIFAKKHLIRCISSHPMRCFIYGAV